MAKARGSMRRIAVLRAYPPWLVMLFDAGSRPG